MTDPANLVKLPQASSGARMAGHRPGAAPSLGPRLRPRQARRSRGRRYPVGLPARGTRLLLHVPLVRQHVKFVQRVAIVRAANAMIAHGISLNQTAHALQIAPSVLWTWRRRFAESGPEGLRPKPWNGARRPQGGAPRQSAHAFVELILQ